MQDVYSASSKYPSNARQNHTTSNSQYTIIIIHKVEGMQFAAKLAVVG